MSPSAAPGRASFSPLSDRLSGRGRLLLATAVILSAATMLAFSGWGRANRPDVLGPEPVTVRIAIEHSRFVTERLEVAPGTLVTFVVENRDPINHELIVGDESVHARHRDGSEAVHPTVPGEVSVGPGETATTEFRFTDPGRFRFACHLPGHLAYGMEGVVLVG